MKTSKTDNDFAKALREWFEEDRRGAAEAKLMFETGFRYGRTEHIQ
jgi:hypothetical protein